MTHICQVCREEFSKSGNRNYKFCSYDCRNRSYEKVRIFECQQCKKEISGTTRKLQNKHKFCSQKCVNDWKKTEYTGRRRVNYVELNCDYCGQKMKPRKPSKINKKNYCNKKCKSKHTWETKNLSSKMVWKPCRSPLLNGTWFRSKWEVVFALDFLEKNNLNWKYEPKYFLLSDGSKYTPDFYIEDDDVWIEIKGYDKSNSLDRFFMFREEYPEEQSILATENVLKDIYKLNLSNSYLNTLIEGQES